MKTRHQASEKANSFFTLAIFIMLLITSFVVSSCKKEAEKDAVEVATEQNENNIGDNENKVMDSEFLVTAASINLEEIELGKLAQMKAQSQQVKDYAKMMVDGHTKSLNDLTALAASKQVTLPQQVSEEGKEKYKDLNELAGKDFDKKYVNEMVKGHEDAIGKFESAQTDTQDADVKAWISATLPELNMHLEHAQALNDKIK